MKNLNIYFSIVILFFVSINISAQEKKQEYNFPGFTLKKCLADYEIKKSNARRVAKLPSRAAQKYFALISWVLTSFSDLNGAEIAFL